MEIGCSPPGPVGTCRPWPAVLMQHVGNLLPPYTLWRCCRFIRPRHWRTCMRGGHAPEVLKELCTPTDLALQATKVTARSLGCVMSTMVVQERHLWLCLADMGETDKMQFLNALVSQTSLFIDAVENFTQQVFAAQMQTQAIRYILARRAAPASTRPPQSNRAANAAASSKAAPHRPARPGPCQTRRQVEKQEALRRVTWRWRRMLFGKWWIHQCLPQRRAKVENVLFLFSPLLASRSVVHKTSTKEHFPLSLGPHRGQGVVDEPVLSPLSRQRAAVGSSRVQSIILLTHPLPERRLVLPTRFGPATRRPSRVPVFLLLPHRGYVGGFVSATCAVSGSLASTSIFKSVWLAPSDHQTRLCDSVRPASSQV